MEHISAYTDEKSARLRRPRFVRWAILVAIVIVLNVFFGVIRQLVFPQPQYSDFCPAAVVPAPVDADSTSTAGAQQEQITCGNAYEHADDQYQLHGFMLLIGLGVLALIIGILPIGSSIVSAGLSYGGVLSFVIASAEYWSTAGAWLKLLISAVALIALIYIGLKRFKD